MTHHNDSLRAHFQNPIPSRTQRENEHTKAHRLVLAAALCLAASAHAQTAAKSELDAGYVVNQMRAFRTQLRKRGVIMQNETRALSDAQLRAVAAYVQSR